MFRNRLDRAFFLLFAAIFALALGACQTKRAVRQPESVASESRRPVATTSTRPTPAKPTIEQLEPLADDPMLSVNTLHDAPEDYARTRIDSADYPVPLYAKYLKGVRICLNPGHGGDAHQRGFKRGPTGVREAEMNLRVALYLRDLLEHVGAEVLMTRTEDIELTYRQRADAANDWPADLFVSLHHNAIGNKPQVNYTTVWHHATVDHQPANLDLARHLCRGLMTEFAMEQITSVPLKSDQLMYERGFAVLRHARVPAALCETSFFTNPEEEQRLRDPEHNLREAYALFCGLAWYAYGGLPKARLTEPADGALAEGAGGTLVFELDDGLRSRGAWGAERQMIFSDTIAVRLDGERLAHTYDDATSRLTAELPAGLPAGQHTVTVHFANMFKNSVLNPVFTLTVGTPTDVATDDA
jgi:N-acetylmuramoyl-L-alanine amidase